MVYKAINTLDSMIGYRNDRYEKFGKVAARLDDAANFVPARIALPVMGLAAGLCGLNAKGAFKSGIRERNKHPSPNAGISEAAFAGALNVQVGGLNYHKGIPSPKPLLGVAHQALAPTHIRQAQGLMLVTSILALLIFFTFAQLVQ